MSVGTLGLLAEPGKQLEEIAQTLGISVDEAKSALQSRIGQNYANELQRAFSSNRFELLKVKPTQISDVIAFEIHATITRLSSGETFYSRQFSMQASTPNQIVTIGFASASENIFQDRALLEAIKIGEAYSEAPAHLAQGLAKARLRDFPGAVDEFGKAIRLNPQFAEAYNARGQARGALANSPLDTGDALADYDKAIELNPNFAEAYCNRSVLSSAKGDKAAALADLNRAIELTPGYVKAYSQRGAVKAANRDYAGAMADYNKAIELDPNAATAYTKRGLLKRVALNDPNGALVDFDKAIELNPNDSFAYEYRGYLKKALHDDAGGRQDLNKANALRARR